MPMKLKIPKIFIGIVFCILSLFCQLGAIVFGKIASMHLAAISIHDLLTNKFYFISLAFLAMQSIFWPLALRKMQLARAYIIMSLLYPLIIAASIVLFQEKVGMAKIIGCVIIVFGVAIFLSSDTSESANG